GRHPSLPSRQPRGHRRAPAGYPAPATVNKAITDLASITELASLARANSVLQRGLLRIRHP
ncbi:MAG TPA: hypothetical protein VGH96_12705, partial [Streptosporangiaceae bacterium]